MPFVTSSFLLLVNCIALASGSSREAVQSRIAYRPLAADRLDGGATGHLFGHSLDVSSLPNSRIRLELIG